MIPPTTPKFSLLVRRPEYAARDTTVLAYIGDGFNDTTFKARVMGSTSAPEIVGTEANDFSRDEFVPTGETCEPFSDVIDVLRHTEPDGWPAQELAETDLMDDPMF